MKIPSIKPFLIQNHFMPEEIRLAESLVVIVHNLGCVVQPGERPYHGCGGVSFEEIRDEIDRDEVFYSEESLRDALKKLEETVGMDGRPCPVFCYADKKWHNISLLY